MSKLFASRRWLVIAGITAVLVLASGGAAYAYFTTTGSGTGFAAVGTAGSWTVVPENPSGTIYPGSGNSMITFEITNDGSGDEQYSSVNAAVDSDDSGNITVDGRSVVGCLASWFTTTVTSDPHINEDVGSGNTVQATVKVTMQSDSSDNQDACELSSPDVSLSVS